VSEQNYLDLYQNAPDMYLAVDARTGIVIECNRTTLAKLGYRRSEVVGRAVTDLYATDSRAEGEAAREQLVERGEVRDVILQVLHRDGSVLDVSLNATAVRDDEGRVVRMRSVWRDVTQRRRAEARLRDEIRRRELFLATLSHELRNPMNAMLTASALLEANDDATREKAQTVIGRQIRHMRRLLDDLLDVSRITQNKFDLRRQRLDLRPVCRDAAETVAPLLNERGVALELALDDAPVPVDGDPARLQQVAINLLSNAAQYSAPGGRVSLSCRRDGGIAELRVSDDGAGIPREMLETIFEPFTQLEVPDADSSGMGLGLTLVRSIAELHGGRVAVASAGRGRGSTFTVYLPAVDSCAAEPAAPAEPKPCPRTRRCASWWSRTSRTAASASKRCCAIAAARCSAPPTRRRALRRSTRTGPTSPLVDIGLPDSNGQEVARHVRARPELRATWLVALTGYGQRSDVESALEAGFDEHMVKPVDLERLDAILVERAAERGAGNAA
jgi:two-component system CheB/CheR fusion protein